ncbi:MAG TPA: ABC transporter permease [Candidatus Dormibacteraeota bacterium]|nr:ABC transporter permease [Candidatus Dormibacteraeota bacterium]
MNFRNVGIVYRKELTEWLRDRRTLISTVLVPLLAFPILMVGMISLTSVMIGKAEKEIPKVMVLGGEDSPQILQKLREVDKLEIVPASDDYKKRISEKEIRAAVDIPKGFDSALSRGEEQTVKIYFYEGEIKSSFGADHVEKFFKDYRDTVVASRLASRNVPASIIKPFEVKQENVAPPEKVSGAALGGILGYMVILLSMTGAIYPAIDLTAGEKERGTMETILSSPISRLDLVLGKFFLVLSASLTTAILAIFSMGTSFYVVGRSGLVSSKEGASLQLHIGLSTVLSVFLMALPLAVFFAAVLLTISLFAKSYKEAQSYLTPMTFVVVIPAVASLLPGVELTPKLALIPILSTSLVCKEIVAGTFHWNYIILILLSSSVYAAAGLFLAVKMFQRESVLFRS